jgi:hypothetical protein
MEYGNWETVKVRNLKDKKKKNSLQCVLLLKQININ